MGTTTLDVPGSNSSSGSNSTSGSDTSSTEKVDYLPYQRKIVAHAIVSTVGFLVLLPIGVLIGRLGRTFTSKWFTGHWVFNFIFSAPAILVGVSLGMLLIQMTNIRVLMSLPGIASMYDVGAEKMSTTHKVLILAS
jgi:small basic protein